jgi:hypothetical protein
VEQLAVEVGRSAQYEILYRGWSLVTHADDIGRLLSNVDGAPAVRPFRSGDGLATAYGFAIGFGLSGMRGVLGVYRAEELTSSFRTWYKDRIMKALRRLTTPA